MQIELKHFMRLAERAYKYTLQRWPDIYGVYVEKDDLINQCYATGNWAKYLHDSETTIVYVMMGDMIQYLVKQTKQRRWKTPKIFKSIEEVDAELITQRVDSPIDIMIHIEDVNILLYTLRSDSKLIILMHYLQNYNQREIGEMYGCTPQRIQQRVSRVKEHLQKLAVCA